MNNKHFKNKLNVTKWKTMFLFIQSDCVFDIHWNWRVECEFCECREELASLLSMNKIETENVKKRHGFCAIEIDLILQNANYFEIIPPFFYLSQRKRALQLQALCFISPLCHVIVRDVENRCCIEHRCYYSVELSR